MIVTKTQGAVIAAIIAGNRMLLIKQPDRKDPCWKLPGGEILPGEQVEVALVRETADETGFKIPLDRVEQKWVLGDENTKVELAGTFQRRSRGGKGEMHEQYFYIVRLADEKDILFLDGQRRREDDGETIDVRLFTLEEAKALPDFLRYQKDLLALVS